MKTKQALKHLKVTKTQTTVKATRSRRTKEPEKPFRFLDLPAEIRNSVYELMLPEEGTIDVVEALKLPSLLASCAQIHDEASSIWYRDNEFRASVFDCDASTLNKWAHHCCTVGQPYHFEVSIVIEGYINWRNLVKWCEAIWKDDKARRLVSDPEMSDIQRVVGNAHNIAMYYKNKSWKACVNALETMKIEEEGNAYVFGEAEPCYDDEEDEEDGAWEP